MTDVPKLTEDLIQVLEKYKHLKGKRARRMRRDLRRVMIKHELIEMVVVPALKHTGEAQFAQDCIACQYEASHPQNRRWLCPGPDHYTIRLTKSAFEALPEYSTSLPTGQTIGKRWKRHTVDDQWVMGEYIDHPQEGMIGIKWTDIEVINPTPKLCECGEPAPGYSKYCPKCHFDFFEGGSDIG